MGFSMALSFIGTMLSAQAQATAMRRQAERQEFQAKVEEVKGMQMHNERRAAYFAFESEMESVLAINRRSLNDRSAAAIKRKAKDANRTELSRMAAQTLFSAGRYNAAAAESRAAGSAIMMGAIFKGTSQLAMNAHRMAQVTPIPSTPTYYNPALYQMGSVGDG